MKYAVTLILDSHSEDGIKSTILDRLDGTFSNVVVESIEMVFHDSTRVAIPMDKDQQRMHDSMEESLHDPVIAAHLLKIPEEQKLEIELIKMISDLFHVDKSNIVPNTRFIEDLGADDLDQVELIMACEFEYEIEIDDEETLKHWTTVEDFIKFIIQEIEKQKK